MTGVAAAHLTGYLAAGDPQAGPIGLAIIVVLGIAVVFLARSMSRHISKVPESFESKPPAPSDKPPADAESDDHQAGDH